MVLFPSPPFRVSPIRLAGEQRGVQHVVAAEGVHRQMVVRPLRAGDVHQGMQARDGDARSVAGGQDLDGVVAFGAVDDDGVGLAVAAARGAGEVQVDRGERRSRSGR